MSISTTCGKVRRATSVARLPGEDHVLLCVDQRGEAVADRGLVVGDEHADHQLSS
jgi:hypothetical protein